MFPYRSLVAFATLIGFEGGAGANGIYAAGPVFGGNDANGGIFVCRIFNPTNFVVSILNGQIWTDTGNLDADNQCKGRLASKQSCSFFVGNCCSFSYNCRVVTNDTRVTITGVAESQGPLPDAHVFSSIPLLRIQP